MTTTTSSVYEQGPKSVPTEPLVLRLKLTPPNTNLSFLQALAEPSKTPSASPSVYVHPMVKRSASALSPKSLHMCTESLGSETGGGAEEKDHFAPPSEHKKNTRKAAPKGRDRVFPPPLTSCGLNVRPHRRDGRLVLTAEAVPSPPSFFAAERSEGRLRLRLVSFEPSRAVEETQQQEEEEVNMVNDKVRSNFGRCKEGNNNTKNKSNGNNRVLLWDRPYMVAT